ncbi:peptide deformylase [Streptomyces sp. NPDC093801]|uniref:peptide deformylase n=1 Tax=Streptomyces sp. NPDC093801 TaxID=3155203 RepID=UPI00344B778A
MDGTRGASFAVEVKRFRTVRGLSKAALARRLSVDPSYVSHLEGGRERGSSQLARRLDTVLDAGGAVWRAWQDDPGGTSPRAEKPESPAAALLVLEDDAALAFDGTTYHLRMRRRLHNTGTEPVTRYLARIAVDRYPGEPERSNALYRSRPLTFDELQLTAHCGDEPMTWTVKHDRDAFKEVWLEFANARTRFPLYPGQETEITYTYSVSEALWGRWFQRAVRLPTRQLSVSLAFPATLQPTVWGTESSLTATFAPLRTPAERIEDEGTAVFTWTTLDPPLHARFRLEWHLKSDTPEQPEESAPVPTPSTLMTQAGIVQEGDPVLTTPARPFDLPAEADQANAAVRALLEGVERVRVLHTFGKGMGLAAPQVNIARAAAVVIPPAADAQPIVLLNPSVAEASTEMDRQYEGCLSFFDVRGLVPRPLSVVIAHTDIDGTPRLTRFEHGLARLVLHEVDHLQGLLYRDRMDPGTDPITVDEYRGTGKNWTYS